MPCWAAIVLAALGGGTLGAFGMALAAAAGRAPKPDEDRSRDGR